MKNNKIKKIVVVDPRLSFDKAFAVARKNKADEFEWKSNRYHTKKTDEVTHIPTDPILKVFYE